MGKKPGAAAAAAKKAEQQEYTCPKCRSKMEVRDCRSIRINGVTYGSKGIHWCCTSEKCDYKERK